jgi:conjugative transfer region protein TrbK
MPQLSPATDPLRAGQRRCQQLGQAAANDAGCLRVWAETRDRFLGKTPSTTAPLTSEGR